MDSNRIKDATPERRRPSPFLDLPGELRNQIYDELLISHDRDPTRVRCYPQILATCRRIHQEASGILYGSNDVQITVCERSVLTNGKKCGKFSPYPWTAPDSSPVYSELIWPAFLRKVRHVTLVNEHDGPYHVHWNVLQGYNRHRFSRLENIFFYLCHFLGRDHNLESLSVDVTGRHEMVLEHFETYPVRLLGKPPKLVLRGLYADPTSFPPGRALSSNYWDEESRKAALFEQIARTRFLFWSSLGDHRYIKFALEPRIQDRLRASPRDRAIWQFILWHIIRTNIELWFFIFVQEDRVEELTDFLNAEVDLLVEWQALGLDTELHGSDRLYEDDRRRTWSGTTIMDLLFRPRPSKKSLMDEVWRFMREGETDFGDWTPQGFEDYRLPFRKR